MWTFLLTNKYSTFEIYLVISNDFFSIHIDVKNIRIDNGFEFVNKECQKLLLKLGILHHRICAVAPQQNGFVEQKHKHCCN